MSWVYWIIIGLFIAFTIFIIREGVKALMWRRFIQNNIDEMLHIK